MTRAPAAATRGSSPLARGLRPLEGLDGGGAGIIPARAGFTRRENLIPGAHGDHPRSRGVYRQGGADVAEGGGSSPLARGLLLMPHVEEVVRRIIPARAGFTAVRVSSAVVCSDHPRSRGVYGSDGHGKHCGSGSSPLARGLRRIPRQEPTPARDHPRSRGVYTAGAGATGSTAGSSPLARGLLILVPALAAMVGIIPARAGFTQPDLGQAGRRGDHPRSRGVYSSRRGAWSPPAGSSPLARGLPLGLGAQLGAERIIPARAGFTGTAALPTGASTDHPRSRGVYSPAGSAGYSASGSSPLARGLPKVTIASAGDGGIIPARAGFTFSLGHDVLSFSDHPRSRGVYRRSTRRGVRHGGSSPLARGLQQGLARPQPEAGIIPARAGFTRRPGRRGRRRWDHPRSRGVYAVTGAE